VYASTALNDGPERLTTSYRCYISDAFITP